MWGSTVLFHCTPENRIKLKLCETLSKSQWIYMLVLVWLKVIYTYQSICILCFHLFPFLNVININVQQTMQVAIKD